MSRSWDHETSWACLVGRVLPPLTPEISLGRLRSSVLTHATPVPLLLPPPQLRQSDPTLGHLISIGSAAHATLRGSGYAFGKLVAIAHSDRDAEVRQVEAKPPSFGPLPLLFPLSWVLGGSPRPSLVCVLYWCELRGSREMRRWCEGKLGGTWRLRGMVRQQCP